MATTAEQTLTGYDMMRATRHWSDCVDALQTEIAEKQRQLEQAQRNVNICQQAIDLCPAVGQRTQSSLWLSRSYPAERLVGLQDPDGGSKGNRPA